MPTNIKFYPTPAFTATTPFLIVGVPEAPNLSPDLSKLDKTLGGQLQSAIRKKQFVGQYKQSFQVTSTGRTKAERVLFLGLGKAQEVTTLKIRRLAGMAARAARILNVESMSFALETFTHAENPVDTARAIADGSLLGLYQFSKYFTDKKRLHRVKTIILHGSAAHKADISAAIKRSSIIAEGTMFVRDLVNEPAAVHTPQHIAEVARQLAKIHQLKCTVYDHQAIKQMGMGGLTAVGQGSAKPPQFVVLDYNPGASPKICIVGKGITFDSGGLDIKSAQYMEDMKQDMSGAAAILGTMSVLRALNVRCNVIGIIPTAENMPGPNAYRPGDILTAYNKKTVEVLNTDAEGRLILMDALAYADTLKPDQVIDLATLTGAIVVALHNSLAGAFGDAKIVQELIETGNRVGERCWPMPLLEEHQDMLRSDFADIKHIASAPIGEAIQGAAFLKNFIQSRWAHLDIAGVAWAGEEREYESRGGTGYGVRLLAEYLRSQ